MSSDAVEPVADHGRAGPLTGVRVLDFTERMQGPYGTQMLGDLGAEVIKVERRQALTPDGRPDERYGAHGQYGKTAEDSTFYPAGFLSANRNKKSITIDLKNEQGKTVVRRLVELSDVVFENFRPAVMARLGFGYEQCAEINPSIVYASASGYGPVGPYDKRPGQDVLAQAIRGLGATNVPPTDRPTPNDISIPEATGGTTGGVTVLGPPCSTLRTADRRHRTPLVQYAPRPRLAWGLRSRGLVVPVMLGFFAGQWRRTTRPPKQKGTGLILAGTILSLTGFLWSGWSPIIKYL